MTKWLISRHPDAIAWATAQQSFDCQQAHLDIDDIKPGDCVYGTLPINLVAALNQRGARYFHLQLRLQEQHRGKELSESDLIQQGARWVEYSAQPACSNNGGSRTELIALKRPASDMS